MGRQTVINVAKLSQTYNRDWLLLKREVKTIKRLYGSVDQTDAPHTRTYIHTYIHTNEYMRVEK